MSRKAIIVFVLSAGILAAALVFDGVSHRRAANSGQTISQGSVTTPREPTSRRFGRHSADRRICRNRSRRRQTRKARVSQPFLPMRRRRGRTGCGHWRLFPVARRGCASCRCATCAATNRCSQWNHANRSPRRRSRLQHQHCGPKLFGHSRPGCGCRRSDRDCRGRERHRQVVSARPAGALAGEANLQLKLTSVKLDNSSLHLATSVRSFGPQIKGKNKVGKFMKGLVKRASGNEREVRSPSSLRTASPCSSACKFSSESAPGRAV
jgi:hypothetical protein